MQVLHFLHFCRFVLYKERKKKWEKGTSFEGVVKQEGGATSKKVEIWKDKKRPAQWKPEGIEKRNDGVTGFGEILTGSKDKTG